MTLTAPARPLSRTIARSDLQNPAIRRCGKAIDILVRKLWLRGIPVAQNGVLRRRFRIRWNKRWEYARSLAIGGLSPGAEILDIGGAATAPVFFLARAGFRVTSCDIDPALCQHTRQVALRFGWPLECLQLDLSRDGLPAGWAGRFERAISFCVIEHVPAERRQRLLQAVARALAPGGQFHLTFDFGESAPEPGALRAIAEVRELVRSSGLCFLAPEGFEDTGERFLLDRRHPGSRYTFGSLFLVRPKTGGV